MDPEGGGGGSATWVHHHLPGGPGNHCPNEIGYSAKSEGDQVQAAPKNGDICQRSSAVNGSRQQDEDSQSNTGDAEFGVLVCDEKTEHQNIMHRLIRRKYQLCQPNKTHVMGYIVRARLLLIRRTGSELQVGIFPGFCIFAMLSSAQKWRDR